MAANAASKPETAKQIKKKKEQSISARQGDHGIRRLGFAGQMSLSEGFEEDIKGIHTSSARTDQGSRPFRDPKDLATLRAEDRNAMLSEELIRHKNFL